MRESPSITPVMIPGRAVGKTIRSTVLQRGDALLVYTDGIIESRARDLDDGIDWMLGQAEAHLSQGFSGLAQRLVKQGRAGLEDDRAAVLIWRD